MNAGQPLLGTPPDAAPPPREATRDTPGASRRQRLGGLRLPPLPAPPAPLRRLIERLPIEPPSMLLALVLDRLLLPRLDAEARRQLAGQTVEVCVTDFGLRCRLALSRGGFMPASASGAPRLRVAATAQAFWRLAAGDEDADTLFFERALVMEGDTEYALLLKNTLDAIGPLVPEFLHPR
jgi:predicted lipid carrier protein YhbT